jgi:hypothetical protein
MRALLNPFFSLIMILAVFQCNHKAEKASSETDPFLDGLSTVDLVARGEYLVTTIGCDHCHTPKVMTPGGPVPDMNRWLMGYPAQDPLPRININEIGPDQWVLLNNDLTAAVGPWGVSFSANLTPHQSGIGNWTFDQFKKAMTEGKYKGVENTRMLLPPMPWQSYAHMKEEDLEAIFAYLQSITPIENLVPNHIPPGPQ